MAEEHAPNAGPPAVPPAVRPAEPDVVPERHVRAGRRKISDEPPREVDGSCSRCGGGWPCLGCLTSTPPYVRIFNSC